MYTISPVYARFVLRDFEHRDLAVEPLFTGAAIDRRELESGGNIAVADFARLLANARKVTADEALGLMIGRHTDLLVLGPVGGATAIAPTLREGLQALENFSRLHASYIKVELVSNLRGMSVRIRYLVDLGEVERFHDEAAVMLVQSYVERVTGEPLQDAENRMGFEEPEYAEEYSRFIHSPATFGHQYTSVELPRHWLDYASPYYNAEAWNQAQFLLAQRMKEQSAESGNTYTQHLRAMMRSYEPPLPELGEIVARLHMSERTLNRRLQQEGSSFRQIKTEVLQNWARQYLAETGHTVEVIAAVLGYQDTANFRRAFRSRENCSPSEYRRRVTGDARQ